MNPIQVLHDLNAMSQVEVFNYIRYQMKPSQVRSILKYYTNELPTLTELDNNLLTLHNDLQSKMNILSEYLD